MDLPDVPLLSMLRERMTWLNQRQDLLSQNVANADTPGYVARDLKPLDFDKLLNGSQSGTSDDDHQCAPYRAVVGAFAASSRIMRRPTRNPTPTAMPCRWKWK